MEYTNAFVGKKDKPRSEEVQAVLGSAAGAWTELVGWMADKQGVGEQQWKGICVHKYGWSLRLKKKGRNILYLGPGKGCFMASFVLSDKAVKVAHEAQLPKSVDEALTDAPRYPEGTGLRFVITKAGDLGAIKKLATIKLAN